jgi:predicted Zn finger-like uncharacterized protein
MALMTACPACNTRFKVVPDQLRLHHGLVRCGACDHVFDANNRLESLTKRAEAVNHSPTNDQLDRGLELQHGWANKPAVQALSQNEETKNAANEDGWTQFIPSQTASKDNQSRSKHGQDTSSLDGLAIDLQAVSERVSPINQNNKQSSHPQASERRKQRQFKKPTTKLLQPTAMILDIDKANKFGERGIYKLNNTSFILLITCFFAGLAIIVQMLIAARWVIADKFPIFKPLLITLCVPAECDIEPAAWLSPLTLDALSLSKSAPSVQLGAEMLLHRMQATVRNGSQLQIKTPDIELTLSNAQGDVIARKTLKAQQLGSNQTLLPNSDWLIDSTLMINQQTVGYTARLVYLP